MDNIKKAIEEFKKWELSGYSKSETPSSQSLEVAALSMKKELNGCWIPFVIEYDEELKQDMFTNQLPDDEQEILISCASGVVCTDTFMNDGEGVYLDSGYDLVNEVVAWQPKPREYRRTQNE